MKYTERPPQGIRAIKDIIMPKGTIPLLMGRSEYGDKARAYIESRGFDIHEIWDKYRLCYIPEGQRFSGYIVIPFYDSYFRLQYYQMRSFLPELQRWMNPNKDTFYLGKSQIVFNEALLIHRKEVDLTEGATDGMTIDALGSLGIYLSQTVLSKIALSPVERVYTALDEGSWGETLQYALDIHNAGKESWAVNIPKGDPNSIGPTGYAKYKKDAILIDEYSYIDELSKLVVKGVKTYKSDISRFRF